MIVGPALDRELTACTIVYYAINNESAFDLIIMSLMVTWYHGSKTTAVTLQCIP